MYSEKQLEKMCRVIEDFSREEHVKILSIIHETDDAQLSENNNGTFIHMESLSTQTLDNIQRYIDYVILKEKEIQSVEDFKDKLKAENDALSK
jgi:hypothetical protein